MIGGKGQEKKALEKVEKVSSYNGRVSKAASLTRARFKASAVAYGNSILVFGGYDGECIHSSCEKYDVSLDR